MKLKKVPISDLKHDPRNPRTHDDRNILAITNSLARFGQVEPLVVQKGTGVVIGGNGRLTSMQNEGIEDVWIHEVEIDDLDATALAIALNRSAELAGWNDERLDAALQELAAADWKLDELGFLDDDLERELQNEQAKDDINLTKIDLSKPPPVMTWVLIGIPTVRYGMVSEQIQAIAEIPDTICEITSTDDHNSHQN